MLPRLSVDPLKHNAAHYNRDMAYIDQRKSIKRRNPYHLK
jgi:hypothetical protein